MYKLKPPNPITISLIDQSGYELRQKAAQFVADNLNITGAERGSSDEQGFGALAEIVLRKHLGMPEINAANHPLGYDVLLPSGVKVDIKCRGGELPFQIEYLSDDGLPREAKHNFFARQLFDDSLNADIYVMSHLETPNRKSRSLPGSKRQRKWKLYVCGWVSKKRVVREGVYLPRGSLTEQGRTWFTYRGQEIEFYNKNLNGLNSIEGLLTIDYEDVKNDELRRGDLNITSVDAVRIAYDLKGRGILTQNHVNYVVNKTGVPATVKPILHPNQYFHLLKWLEDNKQISQNEIDKARETMQKVEFTEI